MGLLPKLKKTAARYIDTRIAIALGMVLLLGAAGVAHAAFLRSSGSGFGFGAADAGYGYSGYGYGYTAAGGSAAYGFSEGDGAATAVSATVTGKTSATIHYTTGYTSTVVINYGLTTSIGTTIEGTEHAAGIQTTSISGLACGTRYYYRVENVDAGMNVWYTPVLTLTPNSFTTSNCGGGGGGGVGSSGYIPTTQTTTSITDNNKPTRLAELDTLHISTNSLLKLQDDGNTATQEDSAVYYIGSDGYRHAFPNSKVYFTWYGDFSNIKIVSANDLASIPLGSNVRYKPGVRMVKFTTDPKVYAVATNGTLRWITTQDLATALYGSDWNKKIDDISDAFYMNYAFGADITAASDFDVSQQTSSVPTISVDFGD